MIEAYWPLIAWACRPRLRKATVGFAVLNDDATSKFTTIEALPVLVERTGVEPNRRRSP